MLERKVWPIFAWISGALFAVMLGTIYLYSFVDEQWKVFMGVAMMLFATSVCVTVPVAIEGVTYEKKPRGWRKERRRAEKEAYVRRLEQELFND